MIGLGTFAKISDASKLGFKHGEFEGDELQLPAVFVTDKSGKVLFAHYGKTISDTPSPAELLAIMKK